MTRSSETTELVREHFQKKAFSFDRLYDEEHPLQRVLRPGLARRMELAVSVVRKYENPRVLDVGCGSGRVGEAVLEAGTGEYVGLDFSRPMLDIAQERLRRFEPRVTLIEGDFLDEPLEAPFDVVIGLGLFDYVAEPHVFARRMYELCTDGGSVVGSFPKWSLLKGPIRKLRYEVMHNCPIFNYTERQLRSLFGASGFRTVEVLRLRQGGFFVRAVR